MENKQLVNNIVLNINDANPTIEMQLSIPIKIEGEELKKLEGKENIDLGTVKFSNETSELIRKTGEAMRKELLSKL